MQNGAHSETRHDRFLEYFGMLGFALKHGNSLRSMANLYYLAQLKRGLVYRNLSRYAPEKIHRISFRPGTGKHWDLYVRDNGQDAPMLVEFFRNHRFVELKLSKSKPKVIYDLGANIGIAALSLAGLYPEACIYGFEPIPANFELCTKNYSNLTKAEAFNCAVGAASGSMDFEVTEDPRGGHLAGSQSPESASSTQSIKVEVWSVADLVAVKGLAPPDFLKVDVEGAELDVLHGLGVFAAGIHQMHIETHSTVLRNKCADWLAQNGFQIEEEFRYTAELGALWAKKLSAS